MAGILDSKTRIFDTILTNEGRRQLSEGKLRIEFASFTDGDTFYQGDVVSGTDDASSRIFFEASSRRQDQITFETDDEGKLVPFLSDTLVLRDGVIISGSVTVSDGDLFASLSSKLLGSSINNYKDQQLIGTDDPFLDGEDFRISPVTASFDVTSKIPINTASDVSEISITDIESFFQDKRLGHIPNFQYLPPVAVNTTASIGRFPCEGEITPLTYEELQKSLKGRKSKTVRMYDSSREGNLVSQLFELSGGRLTKLDIIDFGEFVTEDESRPTKQVYFAGKVFEDGNGMNTFVNIFTIVFD